MVSPAEQLALTAPARRFVSRGGEKLAAALDRFGIDPTGRHALDAGASTGGFTDCLLQHGAAHVWAVDVGYGQLHEKLRADPRVTSLERRNIRDFALEAPVDLVVADLSFISLRVVAPALVGGNAVAGADVVVLIKPQFEAGRAEADRGRGVIRDPEVWARVLDEVRSAMYAEGATMMDLMVSPITGADGNVEFLAHLRAHALGATIGASADTLISAAVAEARALVEGS